MQISLPTSILVALVLPALQVAAQENKPLCNTPSNPNCPAGEVCIKPAANVRCSDPDLENCPGNCYPDCSLTSNEDPCPLGQKCQPFPGISIMQTGYCAEPATCGGFAGIECKGENEECVDDPRDNCDPKNGDADCEGICVVKKDTIGPRDDAGKTCGGFTGRPCPQGYKCVDKPGDGCDPKHGGADCIGVCIRK